MRHSSGLFHDKQLLLFFHEGPEHSSDKGHSLHHQHCALTVLPGRIEALTQEISDLESKLSASDFYTRDPNGFAAAGQALTEVRAALAAADFAVGRAGAMTIAEFLNQGLPALLIPLPTAAEDHQLLNARTLEAAQGLWNAWPLAAQRSAPSVATSHASAGAPAPRSAQASSARR